MLALVFVLAIFIGALVGIIATLVFSHILDLEAKADRRCHEMIVTYSHYHEVDYLEAHRILNSRYRVYNA